MNIELTYVALFAVIMVVAILTITRKMSMGIGIAGIATGFAIGYLIAPYSEIIMMPITNAIFFSGVWDISAILAIAHMITLTILAIIAVLNLMKSGGKIIWA